VTTAQRHATTPGRWFGRLIGPTTGDAADGPEPDRRPSAAQPIAQAQLRRQIEVVGTVAQTESVDQPGGNWFEAELDDGSGRLTLVWLGRRAVPGITLGRRLRARGRLASDRGRAVVFNPDYTLLLPS